MNKFKGLMFNVARMRTSGAHRIASELRINGWDIEVLDYVPFFTLEELKLYTKSRIKNVKFIGISHLFIEWSDTLINFLCWIKTTYPEIKIINGSPTYGGEQKYIDYYVNGWGENAILALLKWLFSNGLRPIMINDKIIDANKSFPSAPHRNPIIIYEGRDFIHKDEWLGIEFSRGCKFACKFCSNPWIGINDDWSRTSESVEHQLKDAYDRFGTTQYVVSDDTFNDREEKILKFANVVQSLNFTPYFSGFIRPDLLVLRKADKENLLAMNFVCHFYGVESFNHSSAKVIRKGIVTDKLQEGVLEAKKYFSSNGSNLYRGTMSFIAGLPGETFETLDTTKKWLLNNWREENFIFYPLHISKFGKGSIIDRDYTNYGYRQINMDVSKENQEIIFNFENTLIWENDNMNFLDVLDFSKKIYNMSVDNEFSIGNFPITYIPKPIKETILKKEKSSVYSETFFSKEDHDYEYILQFAKKYFNRKIGVI